MIKFMASPVMEEIGDVYLKGHRVPPTNLGLHKRKLGLLAVQLAEAFANKGICFKNEADQYKFVLLCANIMIGFRFLRHYKNNKIIEKLPSPLPPEMIPILFESKQSTPPFNPDDSQAVKTVLFESGHDLIDAMNNHRITFRSNSDRELLISLLVIITFGLGMFETGYEE